MSATRLKHVDDEGLHAFEAVGVDGGMRDPDKEGHTWAARRARLLRVQVFLTRAIIFWSVFELVLELIAVPTTSGRAAVTVGRAVWIFLALRTLYNHPRSRRIFLFLCGASAVAIAVQLPTVFENSIILFSVSFLDCVSKAATLIAYLL